MTQHESRNTNHAIRNTNHGSRITHHAPAALIGVLTVAAVLRFVGLARLALIGDEAYYWLWSRHMDWAYYDHPAGVALLVRASTALGGPGEVGVRWLNALLGVGCVWVVYQVGRRMFSRRAGLFAAAVVAVAAPYVVISRFVYTDGVFLFGMLGNLFLFWGMVGREGRGRTEGTDGKEGRGGWGWVLFGVTLGVLFNCKYSAYFYAAALGMAVLADYRYLLRERGFWLGALIAALGLVPVMGWNAAHDWASFRWQLAHATASLGGRATLLGRARHGLVYLTWPCVALALLGLGRVRDRAGRLLSLVALFLLLPVALSRADSPRNLAGGLVPLFLLAGARLPERPDGWKHRAVTGLLAAGLLATAVYGAGTVAGLCVGQDAILSPGEHGSGRVVGQDGILSPGEHASGLSVGQDGILSPGERGSGPVVGQDGILSTGERASGLSVGQDGILSYLSNFSSSAVPVILDEAAGWRELGPALAGYPGTLFVLDYSIAGQVWAYSGRPAYTSWGQYRIWGVPAFRDATVVSRRYLSEDVVSRRLGEAFERVSGPERLTSTEHGVTQELRVWQAQDLLLDQETFLDRFDFLALLEASR